MFAVPGWAIDSTSLVQEKPATKSDTQSSSSTSTSNSKKRKTTNSHAEQASKVSGSELERLWNQQASAKPARTLKEQRREHGHQKPKQDNAGGEEVASTGGEKSKKNKNKNQPKQIPDAQEDLAQGNRDRRSKDGHTNLKNGDAQTTSFPRDKVLNALPPAPLPLTKLTPLQAKMRSKLTSARFRHLNETLYTTSSAAAMELFTNSPDLFAEYHTGFSQQVKASWPINPVDKYIAATKTRAQIQISDGDTKQRPLKDSPLPRRPKTFLCTIADLGCGDALLARGCQSVIKSNKLKFYNFDLHAPNTLVTKADISKVPYGMESFVEEAWRILRGDGKGECWVSEVKSRFGRVNRRRAGEAVENSVGKRRKKQKPNKKDGEDNDDEVGAELFAEDATATEIAGDETDISAFVRVFARRGFQLREDSVDKSNKMFVSMVFTKSGIPTAGKYKGLKWTGREYQKVEEGKVKRGGDDVMTPQEEAKVLKPCVYKTR